MGYGDFVSAVLEAMHAWSKARDAAQVWETCVTHKGGASPGKGWEPFAAAHNVAAAEHYVYWRRRA